MAREGPTIEKFIKVRFVFFLLFHKALLIEIRRIKGKVKYEGTKNSIVLFFEKTHSFIRSFVGVD
jgi:hypothetical protein